MSITEQIEALPRGTVFTTTEPSGIQFVFTRVQSSRFNGTAETLATGTQDLCSMEEWRWDEALWEQAPLITVLWTPPVRSL